MSVGVDASEGSPTRDWRNKSNPQNPSSPVAAKLSPSASAISSDAAHSLINEGSASDDWSQVQVSQRVITIPMISDANTTVPEMLSEETSTVRAVGTLPSYALSARLAAPIMTLGAPPQTNSPTLVAVAITATCGVAVTSPMTTSLGASPPNHVSRPGSSLSSSSSGSGHKSANSTSNIAPGVSSRSSVDSRSPLVPVATVTLTSPTALSTAAVSDPTFEQRATVPVPRSRKFGSWSPTRTAAPVTTATIVDMVTRATVASAAASAATIVSTTVTGTSNTSSVASSATTSRNEDDENTEDAASRRGVFGWEIIDGTSIPTIFRNTKPHVSVRMVEEKILAKYPNMFPDKIKNGPPLHSFYITDAERKLLNEINIEHCNFEFGHAPFTSRDVVVKLDDFNKFYHEIKNNFTDGNLIDPKLVIRGGWIQLNNTISPYVYRHKDRFVPLNIVRISAALDVSAALAADDGTETELDFINRLCTKASVSFEFAAPTAMIRLEIVAALCRAKVTELPQTDPIAHAKYIPQEELKKAAAAPAPIIQQQRAQAAQAAQPPQAASNSGFAAYRQQQAPVRAQFAPNVNAIDLNGRQITTQNHANARFSAPIRQQQQRQAPNNVAVSQARALQNNIVAARGAVNNNQIRGSMNLRAPSRLTSSPKPRRRSNDVPMQNMTGMRQHSPRSAHYQQSPELSNQLNNQNQHVARQLMPQFMMQVNQLQNQMNYSSTALTQGCPSQPAMQQVRAPGSQRAQQISRMDIQAAQAMRQQHARLTRPQQPTQTNPMRNVQLDRMNNQHLQNQIHMQKQLQQQQQQQEQQLLDQRTKALQLRHHNMQKQLRLQQQQQQSLAERAPAAQQNLYDMNGVRAGQAPLSQPLMTRIGQPQLGQARVNHGAVATLATAQQMQQRFSVPRLPQMPVAAQQARAGAVSDAGVPGAGRRTALNNGLVSPGRPNAQQRPTLGRPRNDDGSVVVDLTSEPIHSSRVPNTDASPEPTPCRDLPDNVKYTLKFMPCFGEVILTIDIEGYGEHCNIDELAKKYFVGLDCEELTYALRKVLGVSLLMCSIQLKYDLLHKYDVKVTPHLISLESFRRYLPQLKYMFQCTPAVIDAMKGSPAKVPARSPLRTATSQIPADSTAGGKRSHHGTDEHTPKRTRTDKNSSEIICLD